MRGYAELRKVMREKHVQVMHKSNTEGSHFTVGDNDMFYKGVVEIITAIRVIVGTKGRVFANARYEKGKIVTTKQGDKVLGAMIENIRDYEIAQARYKLSPYIDVFFKCRKEIGFVFEVLAPTIMQLEYMNKFVMAVYNAVTSDAFKKSYRSRERAVNKLHASFMRYIDNLLSKHARLLVVRIDLSYKKTASEEERSDPALLMVSQRAHSNILFSHRQELIKRLSKDNSPYAMLGYAWKLEYGVRKGFHYHLMLFLDGSKVMKHIAIGEAIGRMWADEVTGGLGHYWNCVGNAFYYRTCGVGEVDYYDVEKILAVKHAASYLVKLDRWVSAYLPEGKRCFGKGVVKMPTEMRRGRPRGKQLAFAFDDVK